MVAGAHRPSLQPLQPHAHGLFPPSIQQQQQQPQQTQEPRRSNVSCLGLVAVLTPLLVMTLGYLVAAVRYRADRAGPEFATSLWRRRCASDACETLVHDCMTGDSVGPVATALAILWVVNGVWHVLSICAFTFGSRTENHLRNFALSLAFAVFHASVGATVCVGTLFRATCVDVDGESRTLNDSEYELAHSFRVFAIDIVVTGAVLVGAVYFARNAKPEAGDPLSEEELAEIAGAVAVVTVDDAAPSAAARAMTRTSDDGDGNDGDDAAVFARSRAPFPESPANADVNPLGHSDTTPGFSPQQLPPPVRLHGPEGTLRAQRAEGGADQPVLPGQRPMTP